MFLECGFDVIVTGSPSVRGFGDDDFLCLFVVGSLEGLGEDILFLAFPSFVEPFWTLSPFLEISVFFDVFEVFLWMLGLLDVGMVVTGVEESGIGDIELLSEGDKGVEVWMTIFVFFFGDTNVKYLTSLEFLKEEGNKEVLTFQASWISEENVLCLKSVRHDHTLVWGVHNITTPQRVEGTLSYIRRSVVTRWAVGEHLTITYATLVTHHGYDEHFTTRF